jgi:hypothetical protein
MCVQRFDDSLNPAIHITYRISLRSSSYQEPRDPSLSDMVCFRKNLKRLFRNKYIVILKKGVLRTIHPGPSQN